MSTKTGTGLSSNPDYSQAAKEAVNQALSYLNNETPDLLLVFSSTAYDYSKLLEAISKESNTTNIVGASTAGEFNQSSVSRNSVSIMAIKSDTIKFVPVLSRDSKGRYKEVAENIFGDFKEQLQLMGRDGLRYPTILLMMDAMMGSGEELVKDIYSKTGILSQIVGGAAGDDAKLEKTHVFFGTEALENSIVFVKMFSKSKIGIGVSHGMKNATKPMKVTKSVGGVLYELDGKPAYQVYKDYAETKNVTLSPENTFEFLINNNLAIQDL
ncbi:MAG: FIST signal transduction protein, partial [Candidatus Sericytochromatia bacterium]